MAKRCPTPWKPAHPSPQAAYAAAARIPGQEHYRCGCGLWHVTTLSDIRQNDMAKSSKARNGRPRKGKRRHLSKVEREVLKVFRRTS